MKPPLLLDTCAVLWIMENEKLAANAVSALDEAAELRLPILVSPATAWEIGILASKGRIALKVHPQTHFDQFLESGAFLAQMPPDVLIESSFLPGRPPNDPADRMIIATAREYGFRIVTRDAKIVDYAEQGHVHVVVC